jgi:AcrR family transcriptional regulator
MVKVKNERGLRREQALSREQIIEAAIALLDSNGESGLTFRALAERLATGPGAIYWHVANRSELLTSACDAIISRTLNLPVAAAAPQDMIRTLALALFDAIDAHPWVGAALTQAPGQLPMVRIFERIGQQVCALGVADSAQWTTTSALLSYILGVSGQNAANAQTGRAMKADRCAFLQTVSATWLALDADDYPFTRSMAAQLPVHDDRADFLAGIELILDGIGLTASRQH